MGLGLAIDERTLDGTAVLAVRGDVDLASTPPLTAAIARIAAGHGGPVVVDLTNVRVLDSTGLSVLLNGQRRLTRRGRGFAVACPGGAVRRVFEVAGLIDTLKLEETPERAAERAATGRS